MDKHHHHHEHEHEHEHEQTDIGQKILQTALQESTATVHSDPCVICLDTISEPALARPCRHRSFDFLCLVTWLQINPTCPLCQAEVKIVEYSRRSLGDFKVYEVATTSSPQFTQNFHVQRQLPRLRAESSELRPHLDPNSALRRRRHVYSHQLYSSHVGTNRMSRFRDLTPQLFCRDEELVSRARKWIRRELHVFEFLNADGRDAASTNRRRDGPEFLLEYILAILKTVDIQGPGGQAEELVQEYLGRDNARLFLHELKAWLRSPHFLLEDWDRQVQYNEAYVEPPEEEGTRNTEHPHRGSSRRDADTGSQSSGSTRGQRSSQRANRYSPYQIPRQENAYDRP